jgi:hypothetical protein
VQHHQEPLTYAIAFVSALPESGPFSQGKAATSGATPNRLIDTKVDFDDTGGALLSRAMPDSCDLTNKDDAGKIGHLVERILEGLGNGWVLSLDREGMQK